MACLRGCYVVIKVFNVRNFGVFKVAPQKGERIADVNSRSLGLCSNVGLLVERHMTGVWVMPDRKVRAAVDQ